MNSSVLPKLVLACLFVGLLAMSQSTANAWDDSTPISPGGLDLRNTLQKGLKARRPQEFDFIDEVVKQVDDGSLPQPMVITSFLWARRHKPWSFPYFEFALRTQAATVGVNLPSTFTQPFPQP